MIDIHTHILPGVDDGARTVWDSLKLIRQAAQGGTKEIILTPHCAPSYDFFNFNDERLEESFQILCEAVYRERIPVILHPGMEVLYESREEFLVHGEDYASLCGSRYLLMEYYFDVSPIIFLEGIRTVQEWGMIPVVAHPERYDCVKADPSLVQEGRRRRAWFQVNKGSLSGLHGRQSQKCASYLLDMDMVDFIASDAHDEKYRGSSLGRVYRYIRDEYGEERARRLFVENARKVITGEKCYEKTVV